MRWTVVAVLVAVPRCCSLVVVGMRVVFPTKVEDLRIVLVSAYNFLDVGKHPLDGLSVLGPDPDCLTVNDNARHEGWVDRGL